MLFEIELLYLVAMIGTFVALLLIFKMPSGIALMISAIVGAILSAIFSGTEFNLRHFIEGGFGYFDTILVIITAMIFIKGMEQCGALDYISAGLVKIFRKFPTILLIAFIIILMLPGMITGSSLAAVVSAGAIVAPIMLKMGLPKAKVAAIIAFGAILGMIAPPINIPVMVICDVVDIPYQGFTLPLLALTLPLAIIIVLFLSRSFKKSEGLDNKNKLENIIIYSIVGVILLAFVALTIDSYTLKLFVDEATKASATTLATHQKFWLILTIIYAVIAGLIVAIIQFGRPYSTELNLEEMNEAINFDVLKELNFTVLIPIIILALLFLGQSVLPRIIGILGTPLLFIISFIPTIFIGRKHNILLTVKEGIAKSVSAMGLLIGVGMFVQVMTLSGVRGYFVYNAISLPDIGQYLAIAIAIPIFGGISAFGSASILGGPFVMALISFNEIVVASALSLVAALGEFLPPTAMSATFAGKQVGEEKYLNVTKEAIIPIIFSLIYALVFIILVSQFWA